MLGSIRITLSHINSRADTYVLKSTSPIDVNDQNVQSILMEEQTNIYDDYDIVSGQTYYYIIKYVDENGGVLYSDEYQETVP